MAGEIFISYRRADAAKAGLLWQLLKDRGVEAWYDAHVPSGEDWRAATANALVKAPVFVLLFSKSAAQSDDIAKELAAATFQKKLVVPVRLEDVRPEGAFLYELASRNWFDAFPNTEARLAELADRLTALLKDGPDAQSAALKLGAHGGQRLVARRGGWLTRMLAVCGLAVGVAALGAVALIAVRGWMAPAATQTSGQRVAFFGFSAFGDDPAAASVTATATDEVFRYLGARRVDLAARGDTVAPQSSPRLDRARALGARYALSGEARREGDLVKVAMRVEDVSSRTTLWQGTSEGQAARTRAVGVMAAAAAADVVACIASNGNSAGTEARDEALLPLLASACGAASASERVRAYREMARRAPSNGAVQAALAAWIILSMPDSAPAARANLETEADTAAARARELRPEAFSTLVGDTLVALSSGKPPAQWLVALEARLQRPPEAGDVYYYSLANRLAAYATLALGRTADAAAYARAAHEADPLNVDTAYAAALLQAAIGGYGAGTSFYPLLDDRPTDFGWEMAMASALFLGEGADPATLLDKQAYLATPTAVECYRGLRAALGATDAAAQRQGARRADDCLQDLLTPHIGIMAQARLGDLDRAFEIASEPGFMNDSIVSMFPILFLPATRAMRADPRFLTLMRDLGYLDYWRQTNSGPDVCSTPDESGIPLCKALE